MEKATFGAGCFWGIEATFRQLVGVINTAVGYEGGSAEFPTYQEVCQGMTGHAEVVEIQYDPSQVNYEKLLDVFWRSHDPTTLNRQGPDIGEQYRSVIFFHDFNQESIAKESKKRLEVSGQFVQPIVTEIVCASEFYRAEEYHQRYLEKNGLVRCHK